MISSTVTRAMKPPTLPISSRAICPSDFPLRRMEANRITKSCTAPPRHGADDDPQRARKIAELRGQHRPHQRSRPGDGGEMVAEYDPLVGGFEIVPVAQALGRRGPLVVQRHHARRDELPVEAVGRGIAARRRHHQPQAVDVLPAMQGDAAQADPRRAGHGSPKEIPQNSHAIESTKLRGIADRVAPDRLQDWHATANLCIE